MLIKVFTKPILSIKMDKLVVQVKNEEITACIYLPQGVKIITRENTLYNWYKILFTYSELIGTKNVKKVDKH
jgi:hypothetical protein